MHWKWSLLITSATTRPPSRRISRRPEKKLRLSRRQKYAAKPPPKIRLKAAFPGDVNKN